MLDRTPALLPAPRDLTVHDGAGTPLDVEPLVTLGVGEPESFELDTRGPVPRIAAGDAAGAAYGRGALAALGSAARLAGEASLPAVVISDAPRFAHRGLMLDLARHLVAPATILEVIDLMAQLRLNRLHLHLTDDQGWRLELRSRPELTRAGAATQVGGGGGGFLSQADYRAIQDHAATRNVVVIPEIDLPGHVNAALVAYPELAPAGVVPVPYEGMEVGFSQLDVHNEATYAFVTDVLTEVAALTDGQYLHLGGDECLAMPAEDFLLFAERVLPIAAATGKTIVAWHELGRSRSLPPGTIGQYWDLTTPREDGIGHAERAASFVAQGGRLVLSPGDVTYLDHKYDATTDLGLIWAGGPTSLADSYEWEPADLLDRLPGVTLDDVLGIEATCFTETITTRDELLRMLLPRLAAFAELAWSPRPEGAAGRQIADLAPRLAPLTADWQRRGIPFEPVPELA